MWLLLALACRGDCTDFDEMVIEDPDGLLVPSARYGIEAGLRDFAEWTARTGVCVPGFRVDGERGDDFAGFYQGPGRPIHLDPQPHLRTYSTTQHELCHALDEIEGVVADHPRLFHEDLVSVNEELYGTRGLRQAEAFARTCEDGPRSFGLLERLWLECGVDVPLLPARKFLAEQVFVAVPDLPWQAPELDLQLGLARTRTNPYAFWDVYETLDWQGQRFELAARRFRHPFGPDEWAGADEPATWLVRRDPLSLEERDRIALDLGGWTVEAFSTHSRLVPADDGLYLVRREDGVDHSFWIDLERREQRRVAPLVDPALDAWPLAVVGDRVLVDLEVPEIDFGGTLAAWDLGEEALLPIDLPEEVWGKVTFPGRVLHIEGDELWLWADEGLARVDLAGPTVELVLPRPPGFSSRTPVRLPDGRWLFLAYEQTAPDQLSLGVPLAWNPAEESWHTPLDLCDLVVPAYETELVAHPAGAALAGYPWQDAVYRTLTLAD